MSIDLFKGSAWDTSKLRSSEEGILNPSESFALFLLGFVPVAAFAPSAKGLPGIHAAVPAAAAGQIRCSPVLGCSSDAEAAQAGDWRDVRARLVAMERGLSTNDESYMYESPLIEQSSIILDNRLQHLAWFHKTAILLVEHDDEFTKGVILNRPSGIRVDGWHLWYGGPCHDGGVFQGEDAVIPDRPWEILCLHTLENTMAEEQSFEIMRGVWWCTLAAAEFLLKCGVAQSKDDFRVIVGNAGWNPHQLESEISLGTWAIASAGSATVVRELLEQKENSKSFMSAGGDATPPDGFDQWERLMTAIGREEVVRHSQSEDSENDKWLHAWIRTHLCPPSFPPLLSPDENEGRPYL